jgi:hypothetical protein
MKVILHFPSTSSTAGLPIGIISRNRIESVSNPEASIDIDEMIESGTVVRNVIIAIGPALRVSTF